jgi:serine/threonine-protein kinase
MGVVYGGIHPEIGKRVAIKVLAPHAATHPDLIRRFKEEARAVNKIRHPNIIDIFAFNQLPDGRHYFVMEFLEGESLTARLEHGTMELGEMRRLLAQICSALEAAHEAGIVHRDLKPDNVWVATQHLSEPRIKLLDFGIAKLNDATNVRATQAGTSMGTPHYMAPEQAMGKAVDHRADIYALGVVLYQIFAGALPFDGTTTHEVVFKHVTEAPPRPSSLRPIVPPGMEAIILQCLEKDPARRPQSMRELSQRIESVFVESGTGRDTSPPVIPRLPAGSSTLRLVTPGGTAMLPDHGPLPGSTRAISPTTLRGATGERVAFNEAANRTTAPVIRSGGSGRLVAGVVVVAVVAVGGALGFRAWRAADVGPPVSPGAGGTRPVVLPPAPPPEPERAPPEAPPAPVHAEPTEAVRPELPDTKATAHPRPDHKRRPGSKPNGVSAGPEKLPPPEHEAVVKPPPPPPPKATPARPDCNPNFYLDAQGDKHFKPECF